MCCVTLFVGLEEVSAHDADVEAPGEGVADVAGVLVAFVVVIEARHGGVCVFLRLDDIAVVVEWPEAEVGEYQSNYYSDTGDWHHYNLKEARSFFYCGFAAVVAEGGAVGDVFVAVWADHSVSLGFVSSR